MFNGSQAYTTFQGRCTSADFITMTAPVPNDVRHKAHKQTWELHCVLVADVENILYPVHIISYYPAKMKRADLKPLQKYTPRFFPSRGE